MWAMIPIFLTFSIGYARGIIRFQTKLLCKMGEGAVRFRHPVHVLLLLDGVSFVLGGRNDFFRQFVCHSLSFLGAGGADDPADGEDKAAFGAHLSRHLVV